MKIFFLILTTLNSIYSANHWTQLLIDYEYDEKNTINAFMLNNNQIIAQTEEILDPDIKNGILTFQLRDNSICTIKLQENFLDNKQIQYYTINKLTDQKDNNNNAIQINIENVPIRFFNRIEPNWYQKIINYIEEHVNIPKTIVVVIVLSTLILVITLTLTDHQKAATICAATGTAAGTITNLFV